jgi:hypothetical protein
MYGASDLRRIGKVFHPVNCMRGRSDMVAHRAADRVIVFDQKNPHLSLATIAGASVNAAEPIWSIKAEISHNEKHSS